MLRKLLCIISAALLLLSLSACKESDGTSSGNTVDVPVSDVPYSSDQTSSEEEDVYKPDLDSWEMVLVNKWNPISEDYVPELASTMKKYTTKDPSLFDARAVGYLDAICEAAADDGINLIVISPYRTNSYQTGLFNNKVNRVMKANPDLTREEAEIEAATVVARPLTSEHQLGLAVDFNSVEESFEDTEQFRWLQEHAHEYGFIMRYPKNKQDVTAVIYEPWHYRYVGVENAKAIKESGLCLEEFIEKYRNME